MAGHFVFAPNAVFQDDRLTKIQIRVLLALFSFRDPKTTNTVFPSRDSIAERCGYSPRTITEATTALEELGWLTKEGVGGRSRATHYALHVPDDALNGSLFKNRSRTGNPSESGNGSRTENGSRTDVINGSRFGGETVPGPGRGIEHTKNIPGTYQGRESAREPSPAPDVPGVPRETWAAFEEHRSEYLSRPLNDLQRRTIRKNLMAMPEEFRASALDSAIVRGLREPCYDVRAGPGNHAPERKSALQRALDTYAETYDHEQNHEHPPEPAAPSPDTALEPGTHAGPLPGPRPSRR